MYVLQQQTVQMSASQTFFYFVNIHYTKLIFEII